MIENIKTIGLMIAAIMAFIIQFLRRQNKALTEDLESVEQELVNYKENAKINKDASSATFPKLSDGLLAKQKNGRKK